MAVKLVTDVRRFIGLSSDTKPHITNVGTEFTELDTGVKFIWDGECWVEDMTMYHAVKQALEDAT